jgi:hypothetical protein
MKTDTKTCKGCGQSKPLSEFHKGIKNADGLQSRCKACDRLRSIEKCKQEPLYKKWSSMLARCSNPNNIKYKNYGGRGIAVCDEWKIFANYKAAVEALGVQPTPKHTIDRIDNDKGYFSGNIRWMNKTGQNINKRLSDKNKSGHKGVHWFKNRWDVGVKRGGHKYYVGRFIELEEAVAARAKWIDIHFPS